MLTRLIPPTVAAFACWCLGWLPVEALWFLPVAFLFPSCGCCQTCTIFSDDFSTDNLATDYTTVSGTFSVGSGVCTTTSAGALIVADAAGATGHGHATIKGKVDTSGGSFRLIGSYVDSNNYLYCELVIDGASSTFKLWKRVSGSDTQLDTTYTFTGSTGTYYTLDLCWNGTIANASLDTSTSIQNYIYAGSGNIAGFGASPNGGTATFDDLVFYKEYIDDATCISCSPACIACSDYSGLPSQVQVDVTNLSDSTCGACDTLNGTYVCDYIGVSKCPYYSSACIYEAAASATCGSEYVTWIRVYIQNSGLGATSGPQITVTFGEGDETDRLFFSTAGGGSSCVFDYPSASLSKSSGLSSRWWIDSGAECNYTGDATIIGL